MAKVETSCIPGAYWSKDSTLPWCLGRLVQFPPLSRPIHVTPSTGSNALGRGNWRKSGMVPGCEAPAAQLWLMAAPCALPARQKQQPSPLTDRVPRLPAPLLAPGRTARSLQDGSSPPRPHRRARALAGRLPTAILLPECPLLTSRGWRRRAEGSGPGLERRRPAWEGRVWGTGNMVGSHGACTEWGVR